MTEAAPSVADSDVPILQFRDVLWLIHLYPLGWLVRRCPMAVLDLLEMLVTFAYQTLQRRQRDVVAMRMRERLGIADNEAQMLARRYFQHVSRRAQLDLRTLCERPMGRWANLSVLGRQHLERALSEGTGALLVSVHRFAARHATLAFRDTGFPVFAVHANMIPQYSRLGRRWIGRKYQLVLDRTFPDGILSYDPDCTLKILWRLRAGGIVYIAADTRSRTSVAVPFLGGQLVVSRGVLEVARLAGCPLLPYDCTYDADGLRIELGVPLQLRADGRPADYIANNLPILVAALERQIKACPDQWTLWMEN